MRMARMVGGPGQPGGKSTYVAVDDVDAIYAMARVGRRDYPGGAGQPRLRQPRVHLPTRRVMSGASARIGRRRSRMKATVEEAA